MRKKRLLTFKTGDEKLFKTKEDYIESVLKKRITTVKFNDLILTDEVIDILLINQRLQDLFFSNNIDDFLISKILIEEKIEK